MHLTEEQKTKAYEVYIKIKQVIKTIILFILNINIKTSTWLYNYLNK